MLRASDWHGAEVLRCLDGVVWWLQAGIHGGVRMYIMVLGSVIVSRFEDAESGIEARQGTIK